MKLSDIVYETTTDYLKRAKEESFEMLDEMSEHCEEDECASLIKILEQNFLAIEELVETMKSELKTKEKEIDGDEETDDEMSAQDLDDMVDLANALDESGDPTLVRQASVLDSILLTIGADPNGVRNFKKAQDEEAERLRAKYRGEEVKKNYEDPGETLKKEIKVQEAAKAINEQVKKYRPMETALSTRYSPDMPGVSLVRIGENVYQCPITKKIFNYDMGFKTMKGNEVPGTSVAAQSNLGFGEDRLQSNFSTTRESLKS